MAPFVFNPSGFEWLKTVDDFSDFMNWIWYRGGVFVKSEQSWEAWSKEEHDHMRTTGLWEKLLEVLDEYQKNFGESWRTVTPDSNQSWPYLDEALAKFQHQTSDSVLELGEKLDSLVEKSAYLSAQSYVIDTVSSLVLV